MGKEAGYPPIRPPMQEKTGDWEKKSLAIGGYVKNDFRINVLRKRRQGVEA